MRRDRGEHILSCAWRQSDLGQLWILMRWVQGVPGLRAEGGQLSRRAGAQGPESRTGTHDLLWVHQKFRVQLEWGTVPWRPMMSPTHPWGPTKGQTGFYLLTWRYARCPNPHTWEMSRREHWWRQVHCNLGKAGCCFRKNVPMILFKGQTLDFSEHFNLNAQWVKYGNFITSVNPKLWVASWHISKEETIWGHFRSVQISPLCCLWLSGLWPCGLFKAAIDIKI